MSESLLEVKNLRVAFPIFGGILRRQIASLKAVNGVSFDLKKREVLSIVGESGSGKSTLGKALLRLNERFASTFGTMQFRGKNIFEFTPKELIHFKSQVQIVFQDPFSSLNPRKTIETAIGEPLLYHGIVKTKEELKDKVGSVLRQVGLSEEAMGRYPHQFSGGQQQRICIGRAIALKPKLIICDEVVSALDVSIQAQILNLLHDLKENLDLSYLFISHDLSIVRHLSDRVIVLYLGKVMETATTKELFENPKHPYTKALLSATPKSNPDEKKIRMVLKGEIPSPINPPSGCPFRTRCPYAEPICAETPPVKRIHDRVTGQDDHEYHCIL